MNQPTEIFGNKPRKPPRALEEIQVLDRRAGEQSDEKINPFFHVVPPDICLCVPPPIGRPIVSQLSFLGALSCLRCITSFLESHFEIVPFLCKPSLVSSPSKKTCVMRSALQGATRWLYSCCSCIHCCMRPSRRWDKDLFTSLSIVLPVEYVKLFVSPHPKTIFSRGCARAHLLGHSNGWASPSSG